MKIFTSLSFVAIFLASFGMVTSYAKAEEINLIQNPGFETADTGGNPLNWTKKYSGSPVPTFTYPDTGRSGADKATSITFGKNSSGSAYWISDVITVTAGDSYTFSSWYKSNTATVIYVEYTKTNGKVSTPVVKSVSSSNNSWKQATAILKIPNKVTSAKIYHLINKKGKLTVDDFSFTKVVAEPVPPVPDPVPPPAPINSWDGMLTFSFDDSWVSQYTAILPVLENAGIKGTFYITTEPILDGWDDFMTPAQVKELAIKGHEIGNHTITHPHLTKLSQADVNKEIVNSKTYLEQLIGTKVTTFAYPYGEFNNVVKNLVKAAGYSSARGIDEEVLNFPTTDKYNLQSSCILKSTPFSSIKKAIDDAKANKKWYVLCIHEVKTGGDEYSITPTQFQQIVDYVKLSGIKTVTIGEGVNLMTN